MANLKLFPNQPAEKLAADLRRAFSGIVAGNVKEMGIREIREKGPYQLQGDADLMHRMDELLQGFVAQQHEAARQRLHPLLRNHQITHQEGSLRAAGIIMSLHLLIIDALNLIRRLRRAVLS